MYYPHAYAFINRKRTSLLDIVTEAFLIFLMKSIRKKRLVAKGATLRLTTSRKGRRQLTVNHLVLPRMYEGLL